jgi:hypothetical protein
VILCLACMLCVALVRVALVRCPIPQAPCFADPFQIGKVSLKTGKFLVSCERWKQT